jgi:hypothetical protein
MKRNILTEIIAALFILLFVYTATSKLFEFRNFRDVLETSPSIGKFAPIVAWTLPFAEIGIALLLFFPRTKRFGLWSSLIIMLVFTGYLVYMIYLTNFRPCSCGGVLKQLTWKQHLIFNGAFTILAATGLWLDRKKQFPQINPHVTYSATA